MTAAATMMHQTKMMILLSLNAVILVIVGVMIFSAINLNGGIELRVVSERSDVVTDSLEELGLISPGIEELEPPKIIETPVTTGSGGGGIGGSSHGNNSGHSGGVANTSGTSSYSASKAGGSVPAGELWAETSMTIYASADVDICVGEGLSGLGEMYWQTSNPAVIKGFAGQARTWLGYNAERCRYPVIVGTGTTTITAGTYDGSRYDKITVTVVEVPVEQWKRDVLSLVNQERAKNGLGALAWGTTCEAAATTRAREIMTSYAHTRPNGSAWSTACPIPGTGGKSGENLNAGNAAVSPSTVVSSWMRSPEHRKNILDPDFKFVSVGFIYDPNTNYKTFWSQIFTTY